MPSQLLLDDAFLSTFRWADVDARNDAGEARARSHKLLIFNTCSSVRLYQVVPRRHGGTARSYVPKLIILVLSPLSHDVVWFLQHGVAPASLGSGEVDLLSKAAVTC